MSINIICYVLLSKNQRAERASELAKRQVSEVNLHPFGGGDGVGKFGLGFFLKQANVLVTAAVVPQNKPLDACLAHLPLR